MGGAPRVLETIGAKGTDSAPSSAATVRYVCGKSGHLLQASRQNRFRAIFGLFYFGTKYISS